MEILIEGGLHGVTPWGGGSGPLLPPGDDYLFEIEQATVAPSSQKGVPRLSITVRVLNYEGTMQGQKGVFGYNLVNPANGLGKARERLASLVAAIGVPVNGRGNPDTDHFISRHFMADVIHTDTTKTDPTTTQTKTTTYANIINERPPQVQQQQYAQPQGFVPQQPQGVYIQPPPAQPQFAPPAQPATTNVVRGGPTNLTPVR